ncbi:hypothetical protein DAPPUDRAFT_112895 [Daphnia pulex]|uniref:Uncharacterized protein n=1 Tax=Daphnia pulex TaxID=6669 RepID=E9HDD5_DAPPU|nr:hypothetical protein DAPPUDRAFT_112895 [Daphnia pulex]|eukprot:EFX70264.1 hypothetical protein DAPPUDRAFT_112895 [Daphnia pulex]
MESQSSNSSVVAVYDSSLSAGLDITQYYLSNSMKGSTKQQWVICKSRNAESCHRPRISNPYAVVAYYETISVHFRGFKNAHPHERQARLPITEEILTKMCAQLYQPIHGRDGLLASVVLWRTIWRICLEYHTLGRFSDIVKLKRQDVIYESSTSPHLKIIFKGGKNDQYSEGSERVVAAHPDSQFCPVKLTINYFQFLGPSYVGYLVPSCTPQNKPNPEKAVHYSGALSDLKKLLTSLGYDSSLYGEHSGKRGGAISAAANGGN